MSTLRSWSVIPEREPADRPFAVSDVAQLHRLRSDPAAAAIDDTTWKDLLLGEYCAELSRDTSIFGQQVLYRRLRAGRDAASPARIEALMRDPAHLAGLHRTCTSLRHAREEIASMLFEEALPAAPRWAGKTWLLTLGLAASVAGALLSPLAWIPAFATLFVLMSTQMRYQDRVEAWQRQLDSVQLLLRVETLLGGPDAGAAGTINRALSRSGTALLVPGAAGYADWFMLDNVNHYYKSIGIVRRERAFLQACFERVASLEADIALARHLLRAQVSCRAAVSSGQIALLDAVHPLLPGAQPLTLGLKDKGAFISGQNGIGKSTLLRTVGLNLVAARAFGFCYARNASVPDAPVYASMQGEDSMLGGESLYMAELRRARELLAAAEGPHPGVTIIDEIFRGTNHLESVSAAAAVLDLLASRGMVIVSSHNLVLASLLAHRLDPLCVARGEDGRLSLAPGVLAHTNGIALLAQRGFGEQVEGNAGKVFEWLSAHLAHPADCSFCFGEAVLGARPAQPSLPYCATGSPATGVMARARGHASRIPYIRTSMATQARYTTASEWT